MKTRYKILAVSILFGLLVWIIDSLLDAYIFYQGTFLELAITDISAHEIYIRSFVMTSFVVFGLVISRTLEKLEQSEKALRDSETNYREIWDGVNDAICIHDIETGDILDVNQRMCEMLGYTPKELQHLQVKNLGPNNNQDIQEYVLRMIRKTVQEGPQLIEWQAKDRNGRSFRVEVNLRHAVISGQDRVLAVVRDITERKKAEETLRLNQFSIDHAADAAFWISPDARFLYANKAACRSLGYNRDELLAMTIHDIDPDFTRETWPSHWRKLKELGSHTIESRHRTKEGIVFPVEISINYFEYSGNEYNFAFARNITERKQAEETLKTSEVNYRTIFDGVNDAIFVHDMQTGAILDVNQKMCDMYGYSPEEARQLTVQDISSGKPPYSQQEALQWIHKASQEGPQLFEWLCKNKSDQLFWAEVNLKHADIEGEDRIMAVVRDITERKRAEEELRASEIRSRTLLEGSPVCNKIIDLDSRLRYMSAAGIKQLKIPDIKPFYGCTYPPDFYSESMRVPLIEHLERAKAGEISSVECPVLDMEGGEVWYHTTFVPALDDDGRVKYVIASSVNITERKMGEKQIQDLAKFPSENPNPVLRISNEGIILYNNKAATPLLELWQSQAGRHLPEYWHKLVLDTLNSNKTREAEIECGQNTFSLTLAPVADFKYVNIYGLDITVRKQAEEARKKLLHDMGKRIEELRCMYGISQSIRERDTLDGLFQDAVTYIPLGWQYPDLTRAKILFDGKKYISEPFEETKWKQAVDIIIHNTLRGSIEIYYLKECPTSDEGPFLQEERYLIDGIARAISEAIERKEAEEQLRKLNEELEKRVTIRTAELAAANKELEAFGYSVSHDLRAPLRAIHGFSKSLMEDYYQQLDHTAKDYLKRINNAGIHMDEIIEDLQNLSQITIAKLKRENVNLSRLAKIVINELQESQPERNITFTIAKNINAEGDKRLLQIAMENLIGNAWKFTSTRKHAQIEFGAMKKEKEQIYFIRDNGAGFDMIDSDKLFVAFSRLHKENVFEGTGVGLATVQRIVNRHGGRIWAEAKAGQGATFYFTLTAPPEKPETPISYII